MNSITKTLTGVSVSLSIVCTTTNKSEGAAIPRLPRLRCFIPSAVSPEARYKDLQLLEESRSLLNRGLSFASQEDDHFFINPPESDRRRIIAQVVKTSKGEFVLDSSAFVDEESTGEISLFPLKCWNTTAQVVKNEQARFNPDV